MSVEMKDFLYEMKNIVEQTHTLNDAYERLSSEEKKLIASFAPNKSILPDNQRQLIIEWFRKLREHTET